MQLEQRLDSKRSNIHKELELIGLGCNGLMEKGLNHEKRFVGCTENISDCGIRARFDEAPSPGANVLVRLFWDDTGAPVEQKGRVVWSAPEIGGTGVDVGLRLGDDIEESIPVESAPAQSKMLSHDKPNVEMGPSLSSVPPNILDHGQDVQVASGGICFDAIVSEMSEITPDGKINIVLSIQDRAFNNTQDSEDESLDVLGDWRPRPFNDFFLNGQQIMVPFFIRTGKGFRKLLRMSGSHFHLIWNRLPLKWRQKLVGLSGTVRFSMLKRMVQNCSVGFKRRLAKSVK